MLGQIGVFEPVADVGRGAAADDVAAPHDVDPIGDLQRLLHVLLHEEYADPALGRALAGTLAWQRDHFPVRAAVVGGLGLGIAESMLNGYGTFLGGSLQLTFALLIIVVVLVFKPTGVFGARRVEWV